MADLVAVKRALLSVSDKSGLMELARALYGRGVELISTGGTARALREAGLPVVPVEQVTGFPEMMDGRLKTLHPKIHGGLLALRENPAHVASMADHAIRPIDLVCINLYPFESVSSRAGVSEGEVIENIDIGGPSMVRSAAKNAEHVAVLTDPSDYAGIVRELEEHSGSTTRALRMALRLKAFERTARYDAAIVGYLRGGAGNHVGGAAGSAYPARLEPVFTKVQDLRHGENPHQTAALYRSGPGGIASATQLAGKELSYNNINDAASALALVRQLASVMAGRVSACVIKHANPCGAASAGDGVHAVHEAIEADPVAAYGGILGLSHELDEAAAERLAAKGVFMEVVVAPGFSARALEILRAKSANLRLLKVDGAAGAGVEMRSIAGGLLVQTADSALAERFEHRAGPRASGEDLEVARFLEPVCRALMSNAVCIGGRVNEAGGEAIRVFGAGAGQMDRVSACKIAVEKAGRRAMGAVAFSDAFFPFDDGPRILIEAGVTLIAHPGGSKRDDDTFALCAARQVTCVTTGLRHFRH